MLTQHVELNSKIDRRRRQGGLVDLERVSALLDMHARVDDGVEVDRSAADSNGHQRSWDKQSAMHAGSFVSVMIARIRWMDLGSEVKSGENLGIKWLLAGGFGQRNLQYAWRSLGG